MWLFVAGRTFVVEPIPDPEPLYSDGTRFWIIGASDADLAAIRQVGLMGVLVRSSGQGRLRLTPVDTLSVPFEDDDDGATAICLWLFRNRSRRVSGRDPAAAFQKWADHLTTF